MFRRSSALLALLPVLIAGCGGSGHSGHKSSNPGAGDRVCPQIALAWPAQNRDFAAPTFATAARIVFPNSGAKDSDVSQVVTRPAGTAAVVQNVLLDFAVAPGNHLVRVGFVSHQRGVNNFEARRSSTTTAPTATSSPPTTR